MDSIPNLCQPATLLSGHYSRRLSEGEWLGYPLASNAGIGHFRHVYDRLEFVEIPEEAKIKKAMSNVKVQMKPEI